MIIRPYTFSHLYVTVFLTTPPCFGKSDVFYTLTSCCLTLAALLPTLAEGALLLLAVRVCSGRGAALAADRGRFLAATRGRLVAVGGVGSLAVLLFFSGFLLAAGACLAVAEVPPLLA